MRFPRILAHLRRKRPIDPQDAAAVELELRRRYPDATDQAVSDYCFVLCSAAQHLGLRDAFADAALQLADQHLASLKAQDLERERRAAEQAAIFQYRQP
jgi:hypothetical protein